MIKLNEIVCHNDEYGDQLITKSVDDILDNNHLLTLAVVQENPSGNIPLSATCAYAFDADAHLYVMTPPTSQHALALLRNDAVAITIYNSTQQPTGDKQGLQMLGTCAAVPEGGLDHAVEVYRKRFEWMKDFVRWHSEWEEGSKEAWLYKITPSVIKVFDEKRFPKEKFVTINMQMK